VILPQDASFFQSCSAAEIDVHARVPSGSFALLILLSHKSLGNNTSGRSRSRDNQPEALSSLTSTLTSTKKRAAPNLASTSEATKKPRLSEEALFDVLGHGYSKRMRRWYYLRAPCYSNRAASSRQTHLYLMDGFFIYVTISKDSW
jgi:hypothetical protein